MCGQASLPDRVAITDGTHSKLWATGEKNKLWATGRQHHRDAALLLHLQQFNLGQRRRHRRLDTKHPTPKFEPPKSDTLH